MRPIFVVLLHSPMVDRNGLEVITAVTNIDIHDIARSCKTYGVSKYFIVNPEDEQEKVVSSILEHWHAEVSKNYHPARAAALELVRYTRTFKEAYNEITSLCEGRKPFVVMPDAKPLDGAWSYKQLREWIPSGKEPLVIVYGTGWGIAPSFYPEVDKFLQPIQISPQFNNGSRYNHLSVRAAAAIVLDRLFGE